MTPLRRSPALAGLVVLAAACATPEAPDERYPIGPACGPKPATFEQAVGLLEQRSGGNSWSDERCDIGYPAAVHAYANELALCWDGAPLFDEMVKAGVNGRHAMIGTVALGWYRRRHGLPFDLASTLEAERRAQARYDACIAATPPEHACAAGAPCPPAAVLPSCFEQAQRERDPAWSLAACGGVPGALP